MDVFNAILIAHPGPRRTAALRVIRRLPIELVQFAYDADARIRVLKTDEKYNAASPALARMSVDVDSWPAAPAGLFVVEERMVYVRNISAMSICHEFFHAIDMALGGGVYWSSLDAEFRRIFANTRGFVTPYSATGADEFFAEGGRALLNSFNDVSSPWPRATRARLRKVSPQLHDYLLTVLYERMGWKPIRAIQGVGRTKRMTTPTCDQKAA